jgi:hypothetical protein
MPRVQYYRALAHLLATNFTASPKQGKEVMVISESLLIEKNDYQE